MASRFEAEKFTGKNDFGLWRVKMKALLIQQGLSSALEIESEDTPKVVLDEKATAKKAEIEAKAHSAVVLSLGDKVLREVSKETTAAGILKKLEDLYMTKSLANRLYMKQRLYSYRFLEERSVLEQLEDFNKAVDDLENIDVSIGDEDKAILLLNALPKAYDQLRDAIMYGREKTITLLEVQSALRAKDLHKSNEKVQDPTSESLNVKKFKGKKFAKKNQESSKSSSNDQKETRSCHWCKKPGHLKKDCYAWKKRQANGGGNTANSTDCVEENDSPDALNIMEVKDGSSWIMDSGCSFHMCPHLDWFEEIQEGTGTVILGNNVVCHVKGIGSVRLKMQDGSIKKLRDVRYIPEVKRNLVSLGSLERKGCTFSSANGSMTIMKDKKVVMTGERRGTLYYLTATVMKTSMDEVHIVKSESVSLWHRRLGHPAEGSVKQLIKKGIIHGVDDSHSTPCDECILGKSKKLPYPAGKHTSTSPLDYAHSDLWGPSSVNSVGGGRYYMSIIDDFSRKCWIYILKEKSEAFKCFDHWCVEVEREKGVKLKCLRTDNGLEFLSKEFENYCKDRGIKRHRTVPLNPQQNGAAERYNRTILERVRCMLLASGLEKRFWAEAASTAVKLLNMCPSSSINGDTPDMRWYGRNPEYSHLRIFGCKAFAHLKQGKLDARALRCVMLGYQSGVKGYRLWCVEPGNHKIIVSRDVVFTETEMPFFKGQQVAVESEAVNMDNNKPEVESGESDDDTEPIQHEAPSQDTSQGSPVDLRNYMLTRDRARRVPKQAAKYSDSEMLFYALCIAEEVEYSEPATYKDAMNSKEWESWMKAMIDEIESLLKNGTWVLVEKPDGRKVVSCKWIFKKKIESSPNEADHIRFKARLVARGFTQEEGIDFTEVFSPVVKHASIRMLLALVAKKDWELEQLDVKTAFLHGNLEETIYMLQPEGFIRPGDESKVCLLKKSIYGLKQASRQWHKTFDAYVLKNGFVRSKYDGCVYIRKRKGVPIAYLLLYVDDMLVAGERMCDVQDVKDNLRSAFEMKDLGPARKILGMNILRERQKRKLWLTQND